MRGLFFALLMISSACLAETGFVSNVSFEQDGLKVRFINHEIARGKPYLIVHFEIQNPKSEDQRCDWRSLVSLQCADGANKDSNYDVMVDLGNGGTRATGPFVIPQGRKARASLLFILSPGDLPGNLVLPDGRRSAAIQARGPLGVP